MKLSHCKLPKKFNVVPMEGGGTVMEKNTSYDGNMQDTFCNSYLL